MARRGGCLLRRLFDWLLLLGTPYRGRVVPFHFITYSSRTIAEEATSRNQEHNRAFAKLREMLGDRPLVLDREFSYEGLLEDLVVESIDFVIRLNTSNGVSILDEEKKPISLTISPGQTVYHKGVYYRGNGCILGATEDCQGVQLCQMEQSRAALAGRGLPLRDRGHR